MRLHFLGTGTSFGVPVVGCPCETCRSSDPRDRRTRHAALLEEGGRRLLVDTPPELRLQLLRAGVPDIDAVWFTHYHADHTHGVDDLRVFSMRTGEPLTVYGSRACIEMLGSKFDYVFDQLMKPIDGTTKPEGELRVLTPYEEVEIAGFAMTPLPVPHGHVEAFGFRIGDLGYITDAKRLPERTREGLAGVKTLVLNALWFELEHPTHFNVEEAVEVALEIGADRTYLTHISHLASHRTLEERLPPGIHPSYDGLVIDV
ncbi:MAG TPA: MBL fold metallo-hydrolase [Longimicrobiaceae bacterium]|nr:MBL fold metallo-hydrolase [Longimicrobiaceae bacterium]